MLRQTLLLAYRNFKRFKSTFFINLTGLSTGLACVLLIYLWVRDELSMDRFHALDSRLYVVMANQKNQGGIKTWEDTPGLLGEALLREVAGVEKAVSTSGGKIENFLLQLDGKNVKARGHFASKDYFSIFSYNLLQGDRVLADPNSIVISETLAKNLFGSADGAMGSHLEWEIFGLKNPVKVTGVFQDLPASASEPFDFVLSFEFFETKIITYPKWNNNYAKTFLLLNKNTDAKQFSETIAGFLKSKQKDSNITLFLFPVSDRYLHGKFENGIPSGGRITYVRLFSAIAIFILLIACINFMNLSTAKASRRIKEVGIKKAVGARRRLLIFQYLSESTIMTVVSVLLAIFIVDLSLSSFNEITGKNLGLKFDTTLALSLLSIVLVTALIAGSYPALYLSGFNPATVLKGKLTAGLGDLWARRSLVVFQFTLSVMLIVAVVVVYKQIGYVQTKNLGYSRDQVISFPLEGKANASRQPLVAELKKIPGVVNAACTGYSIGYGSWTYGISWEGNEEYNIQYHEVPVDYDAIDLLDIRMAEGRTFSKDFPSDSAGIIFNETAIKTMGLKDPLGKTIQHYSGPRTIVGVAKDFHFESLFNEVKPLFFIFKPEDALTMMVKLEAGNETETLARLQKFYQAFNPGFAFDYKFLDDDYQNLYAAEKKVAALSKYFAILAILISCLGLFGLAAFTAERRLKEIGIRKVLGSSELSIVLLLSYDFTKMVLMAILIAFPASYFISKYWLDTFAEKIALSPWYFVTAGMLALAIAWLTVGLQTVRAARINPTRCLRDE